MESEEVLNFSDRNHVKPVDEIYPFENSASGRRSCPPGMHG
jgi:hypothetical protein